MGTRIALGVGLALALGLSGDAGAQAPSAKGPPVDQPPVDQKTTAAKPDHPDAAPSLLKGPNGKPAPAAEAPAQKPGFPPPRALDSARTPMPDRLALPHAIQYYPLAPPTPPIPDGTNQGGGAKRVNEIFKGTGGAPSDLPRDSVTRTPEDQLAPRSPPSP